MFKNIKKSVSLALLLCASSVYIHAQSFKDTFTGSTEISGALSTTTSSSVLGAVDVDHYTYFSLDILENSEPYTAYTFSLTLQVTPILQDGTLDSESQEIVLEIENNLNSNTGNIVDKKQFVLYDSYGANVVVLSHSFEDTHNNEPANSITIPNNIVLTVGFNTTRYYELPQEAPTEITSSQNLNEELNISWTKVTEARYYDLEWTWIDNYKEDITDPFTASDIILSVKDFERNSTRIQTKDTNYSIPLVYGRGFIVYRVRAIGNFSESEDPTFTKSKFSEWSVNPTNTSGDAITISNWGSQDNGVHEIEVGEDHEDDKNWQFQASYAEDGKKKEVVSYFDGSLRNRQTVTTINTDKNAIVGEVIYDAQGRPAVEVLPVPTDENILKYYSSFNLNNDTSTPKPYSYKDFDLDTQNEVDVESDDKKMNASDGASQYYSPSNAVATDYKDQIPNANQYPFSQIEYTPDNTGRIRRKGGVGSTHQLGSGHEMEYYYATPEQVELNRLFGYSVGNVLHYKKNMVLDPNRQLSISYIDPQGRTIATALAGSAPPNLEGLNDEKQVDANGEPIVIHERLTTDLLGKVKRSAPDSSRDFNFIGSSPNFGALQDKLTFNTTKTVVFGDTREFNYDISIPELFTYGCADNEDTYALHYNLSIDILNEDGESLLTQYGDGPVSKEIDLNSTDVQTLSDQELPNLPVERGTFSINKTLTVNKAKVEVHADAYVERLQTIGDPCYVPKIEIVGPIELSGCDLFDCEDCVANLVGTHSSEDAAREAYVEEQIDLVRERYESFEAPQKESFEAALRAQWNEALDTCKASCEHTNADSGSYTAPSIVSCETALDQLLRDMSPLGQYGNGPDDTETTLNIFNENNKLYSAKITEDGTDYYSWKNPLHTEYDANHEEGHYYSEDGTIAYVTVEEIITEVIDEDGEVIETTISYKPALIDEEVEIIPVDGFENEYLVEPQYLANVSDFLDEWQDNWAYSLLSYHPEYEYLRYTNALCTLQADGFTSDGFDYYLRSLNTYADAETAGFLSGELGIYNDDPYFLANAISGFETTALANTRKQIMQDALQNDFDGTGEFMIASAYATIVCNSLEVCNLEGNFLVLRDNVPADKKDQFWNTYKANYLALKQRIQSVFINAYAQKAKAYNGCIGLSEAPVPLVANISTYSSSITSVLQTYLSGTTPSQGICDDAFANAYQDKQKRFLPTDLYFNAGAAPEDILADAAEQVDYEYYKNSGICPLARDIMLYLDGYFKDASLSTFPSSNLDYNSLYLTSTLFQEFGGQFPAENGVTISGDIGTSNSQLVLTINDGSSLLSNSEVTVNLSGYDWNNYNDGFTITEVNNITSNYDESLEEFIFTALAKIDEDGTYKEAVITGTTKARITCSIDNPSEPGQYLGDGSRYDETGTCNKKPYFSKAFKSLLNSLITNELINENSININDLNAYANGYLPEFFNHPTTASWGEKAALSYELELDGTFAFFITLDKALPTTGTISNVRFDYIYNPDQTAVIGQTIKITWYDNNNTFQFAQGVVTGHEETGDLLNFLCCDDINNYYAISSCDKLSDIVDGTFESLAPFVPSNANYNSNVSSAGWITGIGSVDSHAPNTSSTTILTPALNCPPSPDGGVFAAAICAKESFYTEIDIQAGTTYIVSFYQSFVGDSHISKSLAPPETANWEVELNGINKQSQQIAFDGFGNQTWHLVELSFVATETKLAKLEFIAGISSSTLFSGDNLLRVGYMGIDGIKVIVQGSECDPTPNPITCESHVGFFSNFPDDVGLFTRGTAETDQLRWEVAEGIADYVETIASNSATNGDMFYVSGYDHISSGVRLRGNQTLAQTPVSVSNTFEPTINGTGHLFQIQNNFRNNSLRIFLQTINSNSAITIPLDVIYCLLSYEMDSDIDATRIALHNMLSTNKSKKIFFILYDTTLKTITTPNDDITGNDFTPLEYIQELLGKVPVDYSASNGLSNSDYIGFTFEEFSDSSITEKISTLLIDNHYNLCTQEAPVSFGVSLSASSALSLDECIQDAECIAQPLTPVSCTDQYQAYLQILQDDFLDIDLTETEEPLRHPEFYTETEFCEKELAHITADYRAYINDVVLNPDPEYDYVEEDPTQSIYYITISEFGATEFGYGYNGMNAVISAYQDHIEATSNIDDIKTWARFTSDHLYFDLTAQGDTCISLPAPLKITTEVPEIELPDDSNCEQLTKAIYNSYGDDSYQEFLRKEREDFIKAYLNHATKKVVENFTMAYSDKEYQYTLYYYDQAGNLKQTVPPEGVDRFTNTKLEEVKDVDGESLSFNDQINKYREDNPANEDPSLLPNHSLKTQYEYNSLNQLVWQSTPDGGETRFAYDALGRIIASQNAKQFGNDTFSYTTYDDLGRIVEAGEFVPDIAVSINDMTGKLVYTATNNEVESIIETTDDPPQEIHYPNQLTVEKHEVTKTKYTEVDGSAATIFNTVDALDATTKANARNRVTAVYYYNTVEPSTSDIDYENALYYNYDIHGNVLELAQHNRLLAESGSDSFSGLKHVEYEYDLISGNVNKVYYQKGDMDQFIHKYQYDADNRIVNVQTSSDGYIWETDASYSYFAHGPLARTLIGDKEVQGMDYAYTIQGWLKGVNANTLDPTLDLGADGTATSNVAKDAMGYALTYYGDNTNTIEAENDYVSIGSIDAFLSENNNAPANIKNLYNGNIKQMATDVADLNETALGTQINNYSYDQLNRIKEMQGYISGTANYYGKYDYDRNGNLKTLERKADAGQAMDDLEYFYKEITEPDGTIRKTNQLDYVNDTEGDVGLKDLGIQTEGNYEYDAIGQLTYDRAEGIDNIDWRVDGKVKTITKNGGAQTITFAYDGLGNRIAKTVMPDNITTLYSRDAQGNVLAVYETNEADITNITANKTVTLKEHHIYGSSRLGIEQKSLQGSFNETLLNETLTTTKEVLAQQNITVAGNPSIYTIEPTGNLILKAGKSIILKPGLTVKPGGQLLAKIEPVSATTEEPGIYARNVGDKRYELTNHLGNVLSVISDRKLVAEPLNFTNFTADVLTYNDYYPFGQLLPNRHGSSDSYRYGFNGKENDDEIKGEGLQVDYGFRIYDPRLGKFLSEDPLTASYPHYTPYQFAGNTPIQAMDLDGLEEYYYWNELKKESTKIQLHLVPIPYNPPNMSKYGFYSTPEDAKYFGGAPHRRKEREQQIENYNRAVESWNAYVRNSNPIWFIGTQLNPLADAYYAIDNYSRGEYLWGTVDAVFATIELAPLLRGMKTFKNSAKSINKLPLEDFADVVVQRFARDVERMYKGFPTRFHRRSVEEVAQLRKEFNKSGGFREKYLKYLANQPGASERYGVEALERMKKGKVPEGMVVHHKKPLFRGGENNFDNFDLIDGEFHKSNNKDLHWYEEGLNPYGLND